MESLVQFPVSTWVDYCFLWRRWLTFEQDGEESGESFALGARSARLNLVLTPSRRAVQICILHRRISWPGGANVHFTKVLCERLVENRPVLKRLRKASSFGFRPTDMSGRLYQEQIVPSEFFFNTTGCIWLIVLRSEIVLLAVNTKHDVEKHVKKIIRSHYSVSDRFFRERRENHNKSYQDIILEPTL
ncbi:hypothetical protein TNCV_1219701 [Trichonephila clavipes]|nr:hypothetical protein TNCV_1219701 [Trichonephila clavipes]